MRLLWQKCWIGYSAPAYLLNQFNSEGAKSVNLFRVVIEPSQKLYQKLSDAGFKPWMDKKDILPGERWKSSIRKAIRRSDFFLVCLSANSIDKRGWIQREIKQALDLWQEKLDSDIYLIPVRLEDCEVPESLGDFQWVNLFEEDGWTWLVKAIQVGMERQAEVIKPTLQESTPFKPYPAHEKPSPDTEMVTPKEGPERVHPGIAAGEKKAVRNPFIYGSPISEPRYFYGRHQEMRRVAERLTNPGFESSSIVGGRRIGKTSVLQALQHPQMRERFSLSDEFVLISINLSQRSDMTQDKFWRLVLSEMQSTFVGENLSNQIGAILREKEKIDFYDVEPIFEVIVNQNLKPVLFLDEFEYALQSPKLGGDFYLGLRSLITAHRLAVVTASGRELAYYPRPKEIDASPFFNVFTSIYLCPFSIQEAHELIKGYLKGTGISFTEDDIECVTRISGCHPHFLQLACSYLFEAYREKKRISKDDREKTQKAVEEAFRVQTAPYFAYYWEHSSADEQSVLTTLAQRSQAGGLRAWMANRRYRTLSGRHALTSLVNQGIVTESDGDHQVFSPLFATWIVHRAGIGDKIPSTGEGLLGIFRKVSLLVPLIALLLLCWFIPDFSDWVQAEVLGKVNETPIVGLYNSKGKEIQATVYSPRLLRMGLAGTVQVVSHDPEKPDINVIPQPNSGIVATRDKDEPNKFTIECKDTSTGFVPINWTEYRQADIVTTMPITGSLPVTTTISVKTNYVFSLMAKLLLLIGSVIGSLAALAERIKKIPTVFRGNADSPQATGQRES